MPLTNIINLIKPYEVMPSTSPKTETDNRKLFDSPETVSFQLEKKEVTKVRSVARGRKIPVSQWLREAAREKLDREEKQAA